jgi:acetyltransferase-like isoleucine patch superfamily enzyme
MSTKKSSAKIPLKNKFRGFRAYLMALPFLVMYRIKPQDFRQISEFLSIIPFSAGKKIRFEFYKRTLMACGRDVTFHFGTVLNYKNITIGDRVSLGRYNSLGMVDMGSDIMTADSCIFLSGRNTHRFDSLEVPINKQGDARRRITIGNDVWVGASSIVMESVGNGCVIGAGAVVTRPVEQLSVVAGNPARVIRKRGAQ